MEFPVSVGFRGIIRQCRAILRDEEDIFR